MTKTAIEIFVEQIEIKLGFRIKNTKIGYQIYQQFKEMEKEQIKQAYQKGVISLNNRTTEEYYEQTFKQ